MLNLIADFRRRSADRRAISHLSSMPDHLLADMGITRDDIRMMARTGVLVDPRDR